jgi:hypothetical protein
MLSRLSSFSGPFSPAFRNPGGFTLTGLILRYLIGDTNSYAGTGSSIIDLQGNSNGTLYNGPTYSINGYLNLDGVNDYVINNISLNSKLSPATSSTVISYFTWIYPQDNGVIISEQGVSSPLNTSWHYSPIEMVSGNLKFGLWIEPGGVGSISNLTSSIDVPLNNWHYVGLTYDGTTMRTYVNGQSAGTKLVARVVPGTYSYGLYYGIGPTDGTNMGDGTYAKMKFGDFHVYNTALSQQQVINNYNATKNDYIYTGSMSIWIDANDPASFSGGSIIDLSGYGYTHSLGNGATSSSIFGFKSFDCSAGEQWISSNITGPTLSSNGYTYVSWARIIPSSSSYRTLFRTDPQDHPLLINVGTDTLGVYDNGSSAFYSSGYSITSIEEKWVQWSVSGDSSGSEFYINDTLVGTSSVSATGNRHKWIGNITGAQPFGYIGNMMLYSRKLTQTEIKQNYDALKNVYKNGDFVIDNLVLYYNPVSILSYPGFGSTVSNLVSNSLNGTFSNITFTNPYFTFNGTSSQITIADNSLLEPGSGSFTMEVWVNQSVSGNDVVLGKFDNGGATVDVSYSIRTTGTSFYAQIGSGSGSGSTLFINSTNHVATLNTWYHIVYVFKNGATKTLETFVNGASIGSVGHNLASVLNSTNPLYIGSYNGGEYSQWFDGKIGIVRIYNSALSSSDVSKNFEANRNIYGI